MGRARWTMFFRTKDLLMFGGKRIWDWADDEHVASIWFGRELRQRFYRLRHPCPRYQRSKCGGARAAVFGNCAEVSSREYGRRKPWRHFPAVEKLESFGALAPR